VIQAARYVGYALINLSNLLDPELIVIGGGVSRSWSLVHPTLIETLRSSPFIKPARRPRVRRARLACIVAGANRVCVLGSLDGPTSRPAAGTTRSRPTRPVQRYQ
jgi:predicted NBD/HSP70 family sugar kinase